MKNGQGRTPLILSCHRNHLTLPENFETFKLLVTIGGVDINTYYSENLYKNEDQVFEKEIKLSKKPY